jgi:hypothetical protein
MNFTYTVLNADISVLHIGVIDHIHVKYVIRHSAKGAIWYHTSVYIAVCALMFVKSVKGHTVSRAVL